MSDAIRRSEDTDLHQIAAQAWVADQLPTLSEHDREVAMKAIQLWSIQTISGERQLSGEQIIEEMVEEAQKDPDRTRDIVSQAQQLQVYAGEPLSQNMDVREAGEVLKRLLFDPDV